MGKTKKNYKGDNIQKLKKYAKKTRKIRNCNKKQTTMKYNPTDDFKKLKPYQYTLATKSQLLVTKIKGKIEVKKKVNAGDFIFCGAKKELYALSPENTKKNYNFGNMTTKFIPRKCIMLTKNNLKTVYNKNNIEFIPSWGGDECMKGFPGDAIILEKMKVDSGYRIEKSVFKKTYNLK